MRIPALCLLMVCAAGRMDAQDPQVMRDARAEQDSLRAQVVRDTLRWRPAKLIMVDVYGQWGLGLILGAGFKAPDGAGPSAITGAIGAELRLGTTGSRAASLVFLAPALWRNWHVLALARGERLMRTPYFGPQNGVIADDSLADLYSPKYYRYALLRTTAFATVQRRLAGPLWLYLGGQYRHYRTSSLSQSPTLYAEDIAAAGGPDTLRWNGLEGRAGLLFDTRDDWVTSRRGLLLEAISAGGRIAYEGVDSTVPYRRWLFAAREFFALDDSARTVLAFRQRVSLASDTLPYFLAYEQLTSWAPDDGVTSAHTIRLHGAGSQLASNNAIVSVELRRKLMESTEEPKAPKGLWGFAYGDFGVLWEPHSRASLDRNAWTIGAGMRLQTGRHSLFGFDLGVSDIGLGANITSSFGF